MKITNASEIPFELEVRLCSVPGCNSSFKAATHSLQSVCAKMCWEYHYARPWVNVKMPPIRRPGDPAPPKIKEKQKTGQATMRAMINESWNLHKAMHKHDSRASQELPAPRKACKTR